MKRGAALVRQGGRFALIYVALHLCIAVASLVPGFGGLYDEVTMAAARGLWPGSEPSPVHTGSGDRAVDWAAAFLTLGVAGVTSIVWSTRPRTEALSRFERRATKIVCAFARLYLVWMMVGYGAVKVLKSQFPAPNPVWLDEALGDMSPMRLLWAFMGHSTPYTVFSGVLELLGAVLLMFRATRLLGALVVLAVMSNVLMLNLAYDVPVKLGSAHLILFAGVVASTDRHRLRSLLVPADGEDWPRGRLQHFARLAWIAAVVLSTGMLFYTAHSNYRAGGDGRTRSALEGRYDVVRFEQDGKEVASGSAPERWQRVLITERYLVAKCADYTMRVYPVALETHAIDASPRWVAGKPAPDSPPRRYDVHPRSGGGWVLTTSGAHPRVIELAPKLSRLDRRGFRWVTAAPYNR